MPHTQNPPRVLVTVSGGVADYVADDGIEVFIFDWDDYEDDPVHYDLPPEKFSRLSGNVPTRPNTADAEPQTPLALIEICGGVASYTATEGVAIEVFDWDDYNDDPTSHGVPDAFKDLAAKAGVPLTQNLISPRPDRSA